MSIHIRRAEQHDCKRILELVQELADYEHASQEVTIDPEHFMQSGFGPNPVWWAFVAEYENTIVGFALYYIRFSTWKGQALYIEDILVTESMRRQKIGSLLFERLIQEAKEKGFKRICWQVLDWNTPAIDFYKKYNPSFDTEWVNAAMGV